MNAAVSLRKWRPAPLILASFGIHICALLLVLFVPAWWRWALGAILMDHAVILAASLWPRSKLLGANLVRLPAAAAQRREVALTFDDGPDPQVTPQVLDILAQHQVHATFFCIGEKAAAHPGICRDIVARGHAIENHGRHHRIHAAFSGIGGWKREIGEAQDMLERITGRRPQFFRAHAGMRNPFLDPVLHAHDLSLASWTRRGYDTRCRDAGTVLSRLTRNLAAGDILLLHDGHAARAANGTPVVLEVLPRLLSELAKRSLHPVPLNTACKPG